MFLQRASLIAQLVKNLPTMLETLVWFLGWEDLLRRDGLPTAVFLGFPGGSGGKESACNERDLGSIPELGRSPREGKGYPLQYSGLGNSMDCIVHGVTKSQIQISDCHFSHCLPEWLSIYILTNSEDSFFSTLSLIFIIFRLFDDGQSDQSEPAFL